MDYDEWIEIGCVLAMIISWSVNHSVLWAIIHSCCSWLYVGYYIFTVK